AGGASTSDVQRNVATAVSVAAGLGLLALVFRRRDIGRGIWLPVLVVGPGLMVARAIGVRPALRPTAPDAFVAFHVTPSPQQVRGYLGIHAGPDSLGPDRRVQLTYDSIVVGLRDGKSVTVMGTGSYGNYGSGTPVGGSDWSWHGCHSFVWNSPTADQSIQLTATQSAIVADGGGIASIDLYGRAVESRARILTRAIPPGTWRNVAEGLRVRVAGVRSGPDDITARLETIDVPHDAVPLAPFPIAGGIYRFEVQFVNTERREVVDLGVRGAGSNFGWMVLPGVATNEGWVRLQCPWGTGRDSVPPDREWLRRANLSVVEWVPSGPYPVHASYRSPN
ncbi:MAG: hypothetical protein KGO03_13720, partial [Gemmatimonadota bacterium]|nr:hypothetical protein [Gemmatimonadota bacterium]